MSEGDTDGLPGSGDGAADLCAESNGGGDGGKRSQSWQQRAAAIVGPELPLSLLVVAALPERPPALLALAATCSAFAAACATDGLRRPRRRAEFDGLVYRHSDGEADGTCPPTGAGSVAFAALMGPALFAAYGSAAAAWSQGVVPLELLVAGSLQSLADLSGLELPPWVHAAQVWTLAAGGAVAGELLLSTAGVFLVAQKVVMLFLFSPRIWGRCFSPLEGIFWAQTVSLVVTTEFVGSCGRGLERTPRSPAVIFSLTSVLMGLLFLAFTVGIRVGLGRGGAVLAQWSPAFSVMVTCHVFFVWFMTGGQRWHASSMGESPAGWLRRTALLPEHSRFLFVQWPLILAIGLGLIHLICSRTQPKDEKEARRLKVMHRKTFHVLAAALFIPPLLAGRAAFLGLAQLAAALVFVVLETCRVEGLPLVSHSLNAFFGRYLDQREDTERGDLVLTHLYLLVGCAFPVWMEAPSLERSAGHLDPWLVVRLSAGVLLVGVGDASAAVFGVNFGRRRWLGSHRTLEGSVAFVLSVIISAAGLWCLAFLAASDPAAAAAAAAADDSAAACGAAGGPQAEACSASAPSGDFAATAGLAAALGARENVMQALAFAISVTLSAMLEVYTDSIDNLALPVFFCALFRALSARALAL